MRPGHATDSLERQVVHRLFTMRWMAGCTHTRMHGSMVDDLGTRQQIHSYAATLREISPQVGMPFVSLVDMSALGPIPRELWLALIELMRNLVSNPERRAVITAEGRIGDSQAEAAQLITAGGVRVFQTDQLDVAVDWLCDANVVEPAQLRRFLLR
jgi:hypothetical protein